MVSLAEKMAANLDMSVLGKADELKKRLWFTIMALIVFRELIRRFWQTFLIVIPAEFLECLICLPVVRWSV